MANPKKEVERAKKLLEEAEKKEKCKDEAEAVGRAIEDLASEAGFSAGEASSAGAGILGIIGGAILGFFAIISGIGAIIMMAIGLLVLLGAGGHYAETLNKAAENLKRANDDLEKCLKRP